MRPTFFAAVVALVAGAPAVVGSSIPFEMNVVDAGGIPGGSLGSPITWFGGAAYQAPNGNDFPPDASQIPFDPSLEWDSYIAMDSIGPSSTTNPVGHTAAAPSGVLPPTPIFGASSLSGVWFNSAWVPSSTTLTADHGVFVAQVTLRPGSSVPTTTGVIVGLRDAGTANPNGELGVLRFGLANATNNGGLWGQSYYLNWTARQATGLGAPFGGATSYAIYVQAVPGPGAAGLLGLGAMLASRRARRG